MELLNVLGEYLQNGQVLELMISLVTVQYVQIYANLDKNSESWNTLNLNWSYFALFLDIKVLFIFKLYFCIIDFV
jgi:hypothetical protein